MTTTLRENKALKRILTALICAVIAAAVLFAAAVTNPSYAAKPKLSKKTITLKVKKTATIKVKNAKKKVKWSTTNKKIATIKKTKGKYRQTATIKAGKKKGTCYIKAKIGKKTLKCKVKVKKTKTGTSTGSDEREIVIRPLSSSSVDLSGKYKYEPAAAAASQGFINAAADFSIDLLKRTQAGDLAKGKKGNLLISPDSVMTALAMMENGAVGNTLTEMEQTMGGSLTALQFNNYLSGLNSRLSGSKDVIYSIANSIWARKGVMTVKDGFLKTNKNLHNAEFYEAPFNNTTVADMNNWVFNNTRNMIDKVIDRLQSDVCLVVMNAIAFEGKWAVPFNGSFKAAFTDSNGAVTQVDMMGETENMNYIELAGGLGFVKYYKGGKTAFVGILPPAGKTSDEFITMLSGEAFINAWNAKKTGLVSIRLPKFSYDYETSMASTLREMGMPTAFTDGADFSGLTDMDAGSPAIKIDDVIHKTHIELDENGTKAAAVTAVVAKASAAYPPEDPIRIHLTRPFVYAIVDVDTGLPLFIGDTESVN